MKDEKYLQFFTLFKKTILPLGWVFGIIASIVIVLSIVFAVQTKDRMYAVTGMIGAALLSMAAAMIMLGKAASNIAG